jgi:L,D-transpeptidase YnhG
LTRKFLLGFGLALALLAAAATYIGPPSLKWVRGLMGETPPAPLQSKATHAAATNASPRNVATPGTPLPNDANAPTTSATQLLTATNLGPDNAETRLIAIYALIEQGDFHAAMVKSRSLVQDQPNFQLAQLVHGDLLRLRYKPDAPLSDTTHAQLASLRAESRKRLDALRNRPAPETVPHQFVALAPTSRHAIAIDAAHSRLYLFENRTPVGAADKTPPNLQLVADFFISVGKSGIDKRLEGDGRTPLGNYYITAAKDRKSLPAFYGAGALPINYPNAFDNHKGRTGSGIWLHGTPPDQFVRAPLASDGCVVVSNPDMQRLLATVSPRTTPVVIAEQLQWVPAQALSADRSAFESVLMQWQEARSTLSALELTQTFGPPGPRSPGNGQVMQADLTVAPQIKLGVANVSLLQSSFPDVSMVATFDETVDGAVTNVTRRQYWLKQADRWQLLQDTVIAGTPASTLKRPAAPREVTVAAAERNKPASGNADTPTAKTPDTKGTKVADPQPSMADQARVKQSVEAWARAWSQKNMTAYLGAYDNSFTPPGGMSRKAWEKDRTDRIVYKSKITVNLRNVQVKVTGNQATVTFLQSYQADQLNVSGRKTLKWVKRGNDWRITQESIGSN